MGWGGCSTVSWEGTGGSSETLSFKECFKDSPHTKTTTKTLKIWYVCQRLGKGFCGGGVLQSIMGRY